MADIFLDFQNIVIEYCIPVSFNVIKLMKYFARYVRFVYLNYYFIRSIYYLHFVCSQVVYFLIFMQYFACYVRFVYFIYFLILNIATIYFSVSLKLSFYLPKKLYKNVK